MFGKPKSILGIDIGAGGVKVVELQQQKKRPVLFTYGFTSTPQNIHSFWQHLSTPTKRVVTDVLASPPPEVSAWDNEHIAEYAGIVKEVCSQARTMSKAAVVSLPVSAVFHAILNLPKVGKEAFEVVLKSELKKLLPYPLEEAVLDYQLLEAGTAEDKLQRVLVNAVPRSLVAFYTKIFQAAGLKLEALETEASALARSLIGRDEAVTMVVDIGAERTNFFIIELGVPLTYQSIEIGGDKINQLLQNFWGEDLEMVEQMKQDIFGHMLMQAPEPLISEIQFLGLFSSLINPIVKEIEYAFELFARQNERDERRLEKIVLTGGAARFPYVTKHLSDKFNVKCYVGDPWGRVIYQEGLKSVLDEIGPRLAVTIGLALKNMV